MIKLEKARLAIFDYTKLVLSALIVILHTGGAGLPMLFVQSACRIAVPTFFAISGFFLCGYIENNTKVINQIAKMVALYLIYTLIYAPFALNAHMWVLNFPSVRTALIRGTYIHLWYFPALIFSVALIFVAEKVLSRGYFYIVGIAATILYAWGIGAFTWQIMPDIVTKFPVFSIAFNSTPNNFAYMGLFFVWLGILVKRTKIFWEKHIRLAWSLLLIVVVIYTMECHYILTVLKTTATVSVSLAFLEYLLMCCLLNCKFRVESSAHIRNISTVVYGLHYIINYACLWLLAGWFENMGRWSGLLFSTIVLAVSVLVGVVVDLGARHVKVLKLLY